jgi:hypothetical protein
MTSPIRHNCQHAVHDNQDMPLPPVPEPDFTPQAGPIPQPLAWHPPPRFPYPLWSPHFEYLLAWVMSIEVEA